MGNIYIGQNGVARKANKIYVGVNGIARQAQKIYIGDPNGVAREVYSAFQPPVKIASNVTSGTFNISQYRLKDVNNFIIDVKTNIVNLNVQYRGVAGNVSKSISGNTLSVSAKISSSLGSLYAESSLTFDIWYIEDIANRYLGVSPINISGLSNSVSDYACEPQYCSGYNAGTYGNEGGYATKSISGNTLTATLVLFAGSQALNTSNSKIYYLA